MPHLTVPTPRAKAGANRRQVLGAFLRGAGLIAAPALARAQSPLVVRFVQQRGLLYIPVDVMPRATSPSHSSMSPSTPRVSPKPWKSYWCRIKCTTGPAPRRWRAAASA